MGQTSNADGTIKLVCALPIIHGLYTQAIRSVCAHSVNLTENKQFRRTCADHAQVTEHNMLLPLCDVGHHMMHRLINARVLETLLAGSGRDTMFGPVEPMYERVFILQGADEPLNAPCTVQNSSSMWPGRK